MKQKRVMLLHSVYLMGLHNAVSYSSVHGNSGVVSSHDNECFNLKFRCCANDQSKERSETYSADFQTHQISTKRTIRTQISNDVRVSSGHHLTSLNNFAKHMQLSKSQSKHLCNFSFFQAHSITKLPPV